MEFLNWLSAPGYHWAILCAVLAVPSWFIGQAISRNISRK